MELFSRTKSNVMFQSVPEMASPEKDNEHTERPFPNLQDNVLKVLGLLEKKHTHKNLNEPDIEEQFARLSLAFKTDRFTLNQRHELQQRQRDIAEKNIDTELKSLRESLNALNQLCTDSDMREVITKTQQHVDIVQQTTVRMSSRAETYGAMQQEQRMNSAFETMLNYVEHLKLLYDKEHIELEEYRRLLAEHNLLPDEKGSSDGTDDKKGLPPRSHSLSSSAKPEARSRLLSAVCLLTPNTESGLNVTASNPSMSPKNRRASMPVGPMSIPAPSSLLSSVYPTKTLPPCDNSASTKDSDNKEAHRCIDPPPSDSSSSVAKSDCNVCDNSSPTPRPSHISSMHRLSYGSSFNESAELSSLCPVLSDDASLNSDEEDAVVEQITPSSMFRLVRWPTSKSFWFCDSSGIMLHLRYVLSATLAAAAMLTFVFTFVPANMIVSA